MTITAAPELVGQQTPTFLWMPPFEKSHGDEVIDLAASAGLKLDPWQQLLCRLACAVDPLGLWLCFELAVVVSRQNGKDSWLEALELAWLFLFRDPLIIHSAHLFETSREHFLRIKATVDASDAFSARVKRMQVGRGSEEIVLSTGERLKFLTRKGGAGRGFTAGKVVYNEAMYLDAPMMAASLPTLATVRNAQVVYAGSAGMKQSTQLALLRRRGYARNDPGLMYAEWAAEPAVWGTDGELLAGDDPSSPTTWAKTNPGLGIRIPVDYVRQEMAALGGPMSKEFGTERLGIGDWPLDDQSWEIIDRESWQRQADSRSQIVPESAIALALDADSERAMGTIGVCGLRADGRDHVEVVERHRGTNWMGAGLARGGVDGLSDWELAVVARLKELTARHQVSVVVVLKTSAAASLVAALKRAGLPVESPAEVEYAQACGDFYEGVVERGDVIHLDQPSMNVAVGGARKRVSAEGGWRWSLDAPADAAPVRVATLALWGRKNFSSPEPYIFG
jgi:phage terminase large subunit-like protein